MDILQQFIYGTPPEVVQRLFQQYFEQMPPELRAQFVQQIPSQYGLHPHNSLQMAQRFYYLSQRQPGWLDQGFRHRGAYRNSLVEAVAMGVAALAAKHLLHSQDEGGLGNLLGRVFGGGQYGGGGMGGIVEGLLGGGQRYRYRNDYWDNHDRGYHNRRHRGDDDYYRGHRKHRRHDDDDDD